LPDDFELLEPRKSVNHICQNVPVQTAEDMATEIARYLRGELKTVDSDYVVQYNHSERVVCETRGTANLEAVFV